MPFESLSEQWEISISDFPPEWLPLTHLYDPDLPLFPLAYFHALDPHLPPSNRPSFGDRLFGYIRYVNLVDGGAKVGVVINKNLRNTSNKHYEPVLVKLVRQRLGLGNPVTLGDIASALGGPLTQSNSVLFELWHKVVAAGFGNKLPFGRMWDPMFGLIRFIASFNSSGGRKGELIQCHYFSSAFGERIASASGLNVDFFLLPTMEEFQDSSNPLQLFRKFAQLEQAAVYFCNNYCTTISVGAHGFSKFDRKLALSNAKLDSLSIRSFMANEPARFRTGLFENYNAFGRGPHRSIISLMMFGDLRARRWSPTHFTPADCADIYLNLKNTFQTPKVIQLYAQQCYAAASVLPIDVWVETFLRWPLAFKLKKDGRQQNLHDLFAASNVWGKIERLIWVSSQARKVHSSIVADALWCIRYGGPKKEIRGANPLSCKICDPVVRAACPAYRQIENDVVVFNSPAASSGQFSIGTSAKSPAGPTQFLESVKNHEIYDEYSTRDRPGAFAPYPQQHAGTGPLTVADFLLTY